MNNPKLYMHGNIEFDIIKRVLRENLNLLNWKRDGGDLVLDVGCGPGNVTTEILLPSLPVNVETLTAVDISDIMLHYAQSNYSHPKVNYQKLDIGLTLPNDFQQKYDHIFSFYCTQFVQNQRQVFKNLFDLLTPGGDMIIMPMADASTFQAHEKLSTQAKWKPYLNNYESRVSPYHKCVNPCEVVKEHLIATGFQVRLVEVIDSNYPFPSVQVYKDLIKSVDPFIGIIPEDLHDDYIKEILNLHTIRKNDKNETFVDTMTKLVVIVAGKPK